MCSAWQKKKKHNLWIKGGKYQSFAFKALLDPEATGMAGEKYIEINVFLSKFTKLNLLSLTIN